MRLERHLVHNECLTYHWGKNPLHTKKDNVQRAESTATFSRVKLRLSEK